MNYSRAGTPTPVNMPGVDKRIDDKMEIYLEQQKALEEAVEHYTKKIALDDWWKPWYENALLTYRRKLDRLQFEIKNTSGYKDVAKQNESSKAEDGPAREGPPPAEEKARKAKNA